MIDFQFYPTPVSLAERAWAKFKNKDFVRVLEPSAGNGDLLKGMRNSYGGYRSQVPIDCCEIDIKRHATLRSLPGVSVVGMDFMGLGNSGIYSHIIQNPPFAQGVHHVLKAWECMFDGEIVSIINAATLKNPNSQEKQHLVRLIEQHGDVEFIQQAFVGSEVDRETTVEIALVYLRKQSHVGKNIVGTLIDDLKSENEKLKAEGLSEGFQESQELAIPTTTIENFVLAFDGAVKTMREAVMAEARANHYSNLIGCTLSEISSESQAKASLGESVGWVKSQIIERYLKLKDKSWANLLRSSNVTSKLSSGAQNRLNSAFAEIKTLEFTVSNIYGFLRGLMENQANMMRDMACDVFDLITRYHTSNVVFYKGWVSNNKQRTCGMRLKKTRFVIPGNTSYSGTDLSWEAQSRLADIDRVLAMLDGKERPDKSLVDVFQKQMSDLNGGQRISSSYLEVRYYRNAGTIHFFPKNQEIMDKLNRMVGEQRQWLPPVTEPCSKDFERQYTDADKFDKELRETIVDRLKAKSGGRYSVSSWDNPLNGIMRKDQTDEFAAEINAALTEVHELHGISVDLQLTQTSSDDGQGQMLLLAA